ncbi:hypothetical protein [Streptomyces sp. NPDC002343]
MAEQKSSSALTAPLRGAASVLSRMPGAGTVSRAAEETLDKIGAVSPRGRRMAVYAGAGMLGAAGVVEWPVALTGAAVAWLTQPRPGRPEEGGDAAGQRPEPAHDLGTAALRSGTGGAHGGQAVEGAPGGSGASATARSSGRAKGAGHAGTSRPPEAEHGAGASATKGSSGPLGPTARPDRTTL